MSAGPDRNYPGDEANFLRSILSTIQEALRSREDWVDPADLADWLAVRDRQLAAGELVYIAHQLDFAGRSPSSAAPDQVRSTRPGVPGRDGGERRPSAAGPLLG